MTLQEAMDLRCFDCKAILRWSGFKGYEHIANCCGYEYKLKPRVAEYELEIGKQQLPDGVIPGKDGGLFHHPV
jgi:hypothetical protein